jgi:peroxin-10
MTHRLRGENNNTGMSRLRDCLATWLESPICQSLSELHTVAFLYGGRYLEFGRRLAGLTYVSLTERALPDWQISTAAPRPLKRPSYEPLALLLLLPLLARVWNARQSRLLTDPSLMEASSTLVNMAQAALPVTRSLGDKPNTYLTQEASESGDRQCTLCLEPRGTGEGSGGTVGVTECGHVFCWGCLGGLDKVSLPHCLIQVADAYSLNARYVVSRYGWRG